MVFMLKNLIALLLLFPLLSYSQQAEIYNQFYMNPYLYNPAYAGVEGHTVLFVMYHQQWANLEGSPTMVHGSFHTPLKGGIGIGAAGFNVNQGLLSKSVGKVSASYLVSFDKKHHLRMGMSVGGGSQSLNFGQLDDPTDPAFTRLADQSSFMIADFGATYHFDHFNVGFAIPNLISYDVFQGEGIAPIRIKPMDNLMLKMNFRGHINHDFAIEPHIIYRYSKYVPDQFEATVIIHIFHQAWTGLTYRQDNNFIATFGVKIKEHIGIGYAYEMGNIAISSILGPTHEIHIGYHLGSKKEHAEHVSSFIKSHQLDAKQRAALAEKERAEQLLALKQSREGAQKASDANELSIAKPVEKAATVKVEDQKQYWSPDTLGRNVSRINAYGERERAVVISHVNELGQIEKAVTWLPVGDRWSIDQTSRDPLKRIAKDGTKEIGVRYIKTNESGEKETVIKWETVVTSEQAAEMVKSTASSSIAAVQQKAVTPVNNTSGDESTPKSATQQTQTQQTTSQVTKPADQSNSSTTTKPIQSTILTTKPAEETHPELKKIDKSLTSDTRTHKELAQSNTHLEVTRGNNILELPHGNYVVAGAFEDFDIAEDFSDKLFARGYHDTIVGYLSAKGYYYVVIFRSDSFERTQAEKIKIKSRAGMGDVWVLKVK